MADEEVLEASEVAEDNSLSMSDEEFLNTPMDFSDVEEAIEETEEEPEVEEEELIEEPQEEVEEEPEVDVEDESPEEEPLEATDEEKEEKVDDDKEINYQEAYEGALAPLKANGKTIPIESIEDLRTLASMGANYNKKMIGLKPYRVTAKKLENNSIDDATLDYLIDIHKGNPEAIQKLLKDNKIDPLDMDTSGETNYSPNKYSVDDKEVELDEVLGELQDSPSFSTTVDIISNKWDAASKETILNEPSIIRVLNSQVDSGIFEQITGVMESERMMGRLTGLSDLEAYKQVGEAIQAKGGFNPTPVANDEAKQPTVDKVPTDPKLKNRKKAASTTRTSGSKAKAKQPDNYLSMSDEDFEKEFNDKYL